LKERPADRMLERNPAQILRKAVTGMLKRNKLRHAFIEPRLKIYTGPTHPHKAQLPECVAPLPAVPAKLHGNYHFGLQQYAHPNSYLHGATAGAKR
jgi:hypothetical protein